MTQEDVQKFREICKAATARPWEWEASDGSLLALGSVGTAMMEGHVLSSQRCKACQERDGKCLWPNKENGDFILFAVNNIEWAMDKIELQKKMVDSSHEDAQLARSAMSPDAEAALHKALWPGPSVEAVIEENKRLKKSLGEALQRLCDLTIRSME